MIGKEVCEGMSSKLTRFASLIGIGLMGGSVILPTIQAFAEDSSAVVQEMKKASYTPEAIAAYQKTHNLIEKAKETKTIEDIRKAYESFIAITPEMDVQNFDAYTSHDAMDQIFLDTLDMLYNYSSDDNRVEEVIRFANLWEESLKVNFNSIYVHHFRYFVMMNPVDEIDDQLYTIQKEMDRYANGVYTEDGYKPLPTDEELEKMVKDFFNKYGADDPDKKAMTDAEQKNELDKKYPQHNSSNTPLVGQTVSYEQIGGVWYEVIQTVVNGKTMKTEKRALSKQESFYLNVRQNPDFYSLNINNKVQLVTDQQWKYYTSDQNPESKWTIHFTVNKDETKPYYYDTGIRVDKDKGATYDQFKDVLLVIADKVEGHLVEDQGKILVVLEGKPIVVYDSKEVYSKKELETLFEDFKKVDIRIMETNIGKAGSLEEQIVSKQAKLVRVDGKDISLETFPMVKNERALLPLEEMVHALGGTISKTDDTYTASKNGNNVIFRLKDDSVYVNGKAITMKNAPSIKDNVVMVEVNELATAFGYSVIWDGDTSTISFEAR